MFVKTLSGQNIDGKSLSANEKILNPKDKIFHTFSDGGFFMTTSGI
jgi:hypothetical protein